jgi:pimeloyl-ACP methyl ester carboxylesterase
VVAGLLGPEIADPVRAAAVQSMANISPQAYRRTLELLVTWDLTGRLHEIAAPTLCLVGTEDRTAPVAAVAALASAIPGAELRVIDGCNHLMNLDRPLEFGAELRRFVADAT